MDPKNIEDEEYREYDFITRDSVYRIHDPVALYVGTTTHRILDKEGIVHCVPAPGQFGCVLRWMPRDNSNPVAF